MAEEKIVSAAGNTSTIPRANRGRSIEDAMGQAVFEAEKEAKAIWAEPGTSDEEIAEKQKKIAAIMSPEALRDRKLKAREEVKAEFRRREDEIAKAASEGAKEDGAEK